jgi:acetylornithine deacetylase/succinyl-diaminopimelate desuccinylase-like protein
VSAALLCLFFLQPSPAPAAEPDWPQVEKQALAFLQQYLRIRSMNPPADTTETAALIKAELERSGLTPKLYESGPTGQTNLVVRLKGRDASKKPLLLLNHMDVVQVDENAWNIDPFGGMIRDGQIWGRGALDMKGLGVQQLMALIALHNTGIAPSRDIVIILLQAIRKATTLPPGGTPHPVVEEMRRAIGGKFAHNKYTAAIRRNTISLTTLAAGVGSPVQVNVIPSTSEASLDCRVRPGVNTDRFISELKERINDPRVTVEIISVSPDPGVSSTTTPLYAAMRQAILTYHPEAIVTPMIVPHGTDSSELHMRGVIKYGFTPMILDTDTAATMHSDQERIPVAEFLNVRRIPTQANLQMEPTRLTVPAIASPRRAAHLAR